LLSFQDMTTG